MLRLTTAKCDIIQHRTRLSPGSSRVRELTRPSSKFRIVLHQFSTVQFPSHQLVWESSFSSVRDTRAKCLCSVPVHSVHITSSAALARTYLAGSVRLRLDSDRVFSCSEEQRRSYRSHSAEIPARRDAVCRMGGGMVRFAISFACLLVWGVVWCRTDVYSVQNRLKKSFSSVRLPDRVGC